ncbi:MAG: hypothetical protein K1X54_07310 [Flavobacteriales bacterium]|nr:hypothetical protein [Flavobacteriales bacterium]
MKNILLLAVVLCSHVVLAQNLIAYPTYQRYLSGDGVDYGELIDIKDNGAVLKVKVNGEKTEVKCESFWGFTYKDELFRVESNEHTIMMLVNKGKLCYYENGESNMWLLKNDNGKVKMSTGFECALSDNLESPLVIVPTPGPSVPKKPWLKFQEEHKELESLFDCMRDKDSLEKIQVCVQKFEEGKLK